jgi:hypothetical protein
MKIYWTNRLKNKTSRTNRTRGFFSMLNVHTSSLYHYSHHGWHLPKSNLWAEKLGIDLSRDKPW